MSQKSYTAFYSSRPFWAGSKIDFQVTPTDELFYRQMSEVVHTANSEEFSLKVCRDGLILIQARKLEERKDGSDPSKPISMKDRVGLWGEYLDYLNTFYLLLDSATIDVHKLDSFDLGLHEITIRDAFRVASNDEKEPSPGADTSPSLASVFLMGRYLCNYRDGLPLEVDPRLSCRKVISIDAISHASEQFALVISQGGCEKVLASFAKSISEFKIGNYEISIVLAWFITEAIVNNLWITHLDSLNQDLQDGRRRINADRKKFLSGTDFNIGIVTNLLELFNVLEGDWLDKVDKVRKCRNKIVHTDTYSPGVDEAALAIAVAQEMIARKWKIILNPDLRYSIKGL
jgi:hypothetical protein